MAREQELKHGDVPADLTAGQEAAAEERPPEPSEGPASRRSGEAVGVEAVGALERTDAARGARAGDPVDRASVEPVRAQRHLEPGNLRVRERRRGSWADERGHCDES